MSIPGTGKEKAIALGLFTFLWVYLWLRAIYIPFTHDEVATFFHYIHSERFIPFVNAHWYANNHVLNSVLSFGFYKVFGAAELSLRMPNLLFFPVFFWFTYKLSHEIKNGMFRWLFIITLCLAHYFIEFFALCRGYGIAMAALMASIYYLVQVVKTGTLKQYILCILFASVASLANLTLINSTVLIIFLVSVNIIYQFKNSGIMESLKRFFCVILFGLVPLAFLVAFALELQKRGLLDVGTLDGFWKVTMLSNTKVFTGSESPLIGYYVAFLFALSFLFFGFLFIKQPSLKFFYNSRFVLFYLLIGNLFITLFLGTFFNVNYPEDRAAMYFFPLLIGSFFLLADDIAPYLNPKIALAVAVPLLFLPVHFFTHMNLSYTIFWKDLRIPYRFYDTVQKDAVDGQAAPTVAGYKMRGLSWAFMNFRRGGDGTQIHSSGYPEVNADFLVASIKDRPDWRLQYDSLDYDPYSDLWLLKRKNPAIYSLITKTPIGATEEKTKNEYWNLFEGAVDSLAGKTLLVTVDMSVTSHTNPFVGWVVADLADTSGQSLRYEFISLDFACTEWNGEPHNFLKSTIVHDLPPGSHILKVYFWNSLGMTYTIKEASCKIEVME